MKQGEEDETTRGSKDERMIGGEDGGVASACVQDAGEGRSTSRVKNICRAAFSDALSGSTECNCLQVAKHDILFSNRIHCSVRCNT